MQHAVPPDARTRVLDAAETLVRGFGVASLTLEAAARAAGVSKGGLLYHFASKEALLVALMSRIAAAIEADFRAAVARQPAGPGQVARAMLAFAFGVPGDIAADHVDRAAAVFLAAHHHDPALLAPVREVIGRMRDGVAGDGLPEGHGMAIMAAVDGLMLARLFGLYQLADEERQAMGAALARLLAP